MQTEEEYISLEELLQDPLSQKAEDVARRIYTNLCEIWLAEHGMKMTEAVLVRVQDKSQGGKIIWNVKN